MINVVVFHKQANKTSKKKFEMFSMILQQIRNIIVKTKKILEANLEIDFDFFENQQRENEKIHTQMLRILAKIQERIEFQKNRKSVDS